jgi:uncharacterized RDD family membrane protein YckC
VSDDPFGRRADERTDAFGRPLAGEESDEVRPAPPAPPDGPPPGGFAPPTDSPPDTTSWWADSRPGTIEGRAHPEARGPLTGQPAEWAQRAGAAVLDLVVRIGIWIVGMLIGAVAFVGGGEAGGAGLTVGLIVGIVASVAYAPWMVATRNGQTLGHRATNTRVVRSDGSPLSAGGAIVREVIAKGILFEGILSTFSFGIALLLNYLWPLWDDRNEALHDKMCSTRVLKA